MGVEIQDLGAIPDDPLLLEKTLIKAGRKF
jgi:hypothetical protein